MPFVPRHVGRDESPKENYGRRADCGRYVVQAAFRPDIRTADREHRGSVAEGRRNDLQNVSWQCLRRLGDALHKIATLHRQFKPSHHRPRLVVMADYFHVRFDHHQPPEGLGEGQLFGREHDFGRRRLEGLP